MQDNDSLDNKYIVVQKNDSIFHIPHTTGKIQNWYKLYYENWENDTFQLMNQFTNKDKILFDIGSWVGLLSIPYSYHFSKVIAVEADCDAVADFKKIIEANQITNIEIVEKAVFHESDTIVYFGPSNFRTDLPNLNESTSHIKYDQIKNNDYPVRTIRLLDVVSPYLSSVGFIKIDIEGGEGYLLDDVLHLLQLHIPVLISFHFPWIENKSSVYNFSSSIQKNNITCYNINYSKLTTPLYDYIQLYQNHFTSVLIIKE